MELVSRQEQLARLEELLQRSLRGQMQIALLTGEAGIGKTALLQAFTVRAQQMHPELFITQSQCYEVPGAGQEAYAPFIHLLDEIVGGKKDSITWDRLRLSLVELAPDWLQQLPGGNLGAAAIRTMPWERAAGEKAEATEKQRRMVQIVNVLRLVSHNSPMVLAIDNLHWCDSASLELLSFLADQLPVCPILIILLIRPGPISHRVQGEQHPVRKLLTQLKRYGRCLEIELPRFQEADVREYLFRQGYRFPEPFIEQLTQRSKGSPLFLREYLALLQARGQIYREDGRFILAEKALTTEIPASLETVVQQRLQLIAGDLRDLLSHANAHGEHFAAQVLSGTMSEVPESRIFKYLNQLEEDYRLVSELEDQRLVVKVGPEYRFVHALLQQVLYQDLSEGQRRLLHQVIARLLESLYAEDASAHSVSLANHYEMGGNIPRAINYYFQACQHAISTQELEEALKLAHKTEELARRILTTDHRATPWLAQALLQEAEIHFWSGDYRSTLACTHEGDRIAEQNSLRELRASFHYWQSRALRALGQAGESVEKARKALQMLDEQSSIRMRGLLHAYLGSVNDSLPVEELTQHLNEALHIAEINSLTDVKVKALLEMGGLAIFRTDRPLDTLNYARQASKIAGANGMFNEQVTACRQEALACLRLGRFDEALALDQQAVEIARLHNLPVALHLALYSLALSWASGMDSPSKGLEVLHESLEIARQHHLRPSRNVYGALFNISFALGGWEEARKAQELFYNTVATTYPRGLGYHLRMKGHEQYALGQYESAVESYRSAIAMYRKHSPDGRDVRTVEPYLGMALVEAGDNQTARPLLEDACDFWRGRQASRYARSLCALAAHYLKRGACNQAIPLLRQALVSTEHAASDQPWPIRPQISMMLGSALMMNGEREEALVHAQWAYEHYKRMAHFLTGDAAFTLGQIFEDMKKPALAEPYLVEARQKWTDLGLEHRMKLLV